MNFFVDEWRIICRQKLANLRTSYSENIELTKTDDTKARLVQVFYSFHLIFIYFMGEKDLSRK